MSDYKSVQDLIVKAAMYDKVSTTIKANELFGGRDVIEIIFQKGNRYSATNIDVYPGVIDHEGMTLHACKKALRELFMAPYDEIECVKENENENT